MEAKTQIFLNKQMTLFHWLEACGEALKIETVKPKKDYKYDLTDDLTNGVVLLRIIQIATGKEGDFPTMPRSITERLFNLTEIQSFANTELNISVFSELDINQYTYSQFYKKLLSDYYEIAIKMAAKYTEVLPPMGKLERAPQTNKYGGQIFSTDDLVGEAYYANSARLLVSLRMAIRDLACKTDPWTGIGQLLGKEDVNAQTNGDFGKTAGQGVIPPQLASICNKSITLREENFLLESLSHALAKRTEENNQYISEHVDSDNSKLFDAKTSAFGKIYRDSLKIRGEEQKSTTKGDKKSAKASKLVMPTEKYDYTVKLCKGLSKANKEQNEIIKGKTQLAGILGNDSSPSSTQQIRSHSPLGATQTTLKELNEPKSTVILPEFGHDPEVVATNSAYEVQLKDMKLRMNQSGDKLAKLKNKNIQQASTYTKLSKQTKEMDESLKKCKQEFNDLSKEYAKLRHQCSEAIAYYRGTDILVDPSSPNGGKSYTVKDVGAVIKKKKTTVCSLRSQLDELEKNIKECEVKVGMAANNGPLVEAQL